MKFVVASQYEGKTSDLIELGKKLVKKHPEASKQGEITLYYTGSTYTLDQQELELRWTIYISKPVS